MNCTLSHLQKKSQEDSHWPGSHSTHHALTQPIPCVLHSTQGQAEDKPAWSQPPVECWSEDMEWWWVLKKRNTAFLFIFWSHFTDKIPLIEKMKTWRWEVWLHCAQVNVSHEGSIATSLVWLESYSKGLHNMRKQLCLLHTRRVLLVSPICKHVLIEFTRSPKMHWHSCSSCACSVDKSYPSHCDPMNSSLPGSSVHGIPGKNMGVDCHFLLQSFIRNRTLNHQYCNSRESPSLFLPSLIRS